MIELIEKGGQVLRKQTPTDGNWLFQFEENTNTYILSKQIYLGKDATEWQECTEEEKKEFEKHNEKILAEEANF
jgi:hypothetical protein